MFNSQGILNKLGYARGAMVKSVQRGIATISTAVTNVDVTISAVITANSVVVCRPRGGPVSYAKDKFPVTTITGTTTINVAIDTAPLYDTYMIWEVYEYYSGVVKSKQTGTVASGTITTTSGYALTVTGVDVAKTMLIANHTCTSIDVGTFTNNELASSAFLEDSTTIRFRNGSSIDYTFLGVFKWQLVEFY